MDRDKARNFFGDEVPQGSDDRLLLSFDHAKAIYEHPNLQLPLLFEVRSPIGRKAYCGVAQFLVE